MSSQTEKNSIKVWDPLVRLFHWSLVIAFAIAYFTQEEEYELHLLAGYTVLGLIVLRILWGLVGPKHARFTDFIFPPAATLRYLRDVIKGRAHRYLGHNPAAGMMVVALLISLLVICVSGVALDAAENRAGPLAGMRLFLYADIVADIHELFTDIISFLIPLHLLGVLFSSRAHHENLVRAMIDGRKRVESTATMTEQNGERS